MTTLDDLLNVARRWRDAKIPNTSSAPWPETKALLEVIAALDPTPCPHDRQWRVYFSTPTELCGYCGVALKEDE